MDRATIKAPTTAFNPSGFSYQSVESGYFEQRRLQRHAGFFTLLTLGVGAVVAGQYSGGAYSFARTTMGPWGLSGCVARPGRDDTRLPCSSQTYASTVRKLFDAKQWR